MNTWLNSTVHSFLDNFGEVEIPVVVEVGSRDGHDAVELARRISRGGAYQEELGAVMCFEPNPVSAQAIRRNYPLVYVVEKAASDKTGRAEFMAYEGNEGDVGSSSLNLNWKGDDLAGEVITVDTVRLDEVLANDEVDIMKIDVEGHSLEVLHGLGDKLRLVKVYHIETESWTGSDAAVKKYMTEHGYMLYDEMEQYGGMPDLVFVRV